MDEDLAKRLRNIKKFDQYAVKVSAAVSLEYYEANFGGSQLYALKKSLP
jgi:hypothetical protein